MSSAQISLRFAGLPSRVGSAAAGSASAVELDRNGGEGKMYDDIVEWTYTGYNYVYIYIIILYG